MSRHEGVSCDSCSKRNFRGRRYKCLICIDYDLCASCHEAGATTTTHTTEHPMQCILTRSDFDMFYGGESLTLEQPQSFTCPHCGKMGFTDVSLQEHVTSEHTETSDEVLCPVCASVPGADPNLLTQDLSGHLNLEHRNAPRDLISFLEEPSGLRHGPRRAPHPSRGVGVSRPRRCNMHLNNTGGLVSISPSSRETVDPIAELLSQLSGVRRTAASGTGQNSSPAQLQQLQMQLQLERQQVRAVRTQVERLPRRPAQPSTSNSGNTAGSGATTAASVAANTTLASASDHGSSLAPSANLQFLLARCTEPVLTEVGLQAAEQERADRSLFVQELVLSTLSEATASLLIMSQSAPAQNKSSGSSETCPSSRESSGGAGGTRFQSSQSQAAPATSPAASSASSLQKNSSSSSAAIAKRTNSRGLVSGSGPVTGSSSGTRTQQSAQPQQSHHLRDGVPRGAIVSLQSQPAPTPPQPQPMRVVAGTGSIREVVNAPNYGSPGANRRKPLRTATEPPPPH